MDGVRLDGGRSCDPQVLFSARFPSEKTPGSNRNHDLGIVDLFPFFELLFFDVFIPMASLALFMTLPPTRPHHHTLRMPAMPRFLPARLLGKAGHARQ